MHARYYNVPLDDLIAIMQNALKNGYTIAWDGDVSEQGFSHAKGLAILPTNEPQNMSGSDRARFEKLPEAEKNNLYSFVAPVPEMQVNDQNRQETFDKRKTTDDHLMHLTGLLQDQNGTYYYKTKNSWGTERNPFGGWQAPRQGNPGQMRAACDSGGRQNPAGKSDGFHPVSYTHLRAHET